MRILAPMCGRKLSGQTAQILHVHAEGRARCQGKKAEGKAGPLGKAEALVGFMEDTCTEN